MLLVEKEDQFVSIRSVASCYGVLASRLEFSLQASARGGGCQQRSLVRSLAKVQKLLQPLAGACSRCVSWLSLSAKTIAAIPLSQMVLGRREFSQFCLGFLLSFDRSFLDCSAPDDLKKLRLRDLISAKKVALLRLISLFS